MLSKAMREYHDGVYVVTNRMFTDRQAATLRELGDGNFDFVYSVDRPDVTREDFIAEGIYDEATAIKLDRRNKSMPAGHICCSIGHRNVYQRMVDARISRALIFEDDVTIRSADETEIAAILNAIPEDAEMIYWGWRDNATIPWYAPIKKAVYKIQHRLGLLKYDDVMIDNLYSRPYNDHFRIAGKHFYAHAYTLTLEGAKKLIELNTPIVLNADNAIQYAVMKGTLRSYISLRILFDQRSQDLDNPIASLTNV